MGSTILNILVGVATGSFLSIAVYGICKLIGRHIVTVAIYAATFGGLLATIVVSMIFSVFEQSFYQAFTIGRIIAIISSSELIVFITLSLLLWVITSNARVKQPK